MVVPMVHHVFTTVPQNVTVDSGTVAEEMHLGSAFLHGALAAAPGIFAISSCDARWQRL